jgi:hypothetical protein
MIQPIAPASFIVPDKISVEVVVEQSHRDESRKGQDFWTRLTVDPGERTGEVMQKIDVHNTRKPELEGYLTFTKEQTKQLSDYLLKAIKSVEEREQYVSEENCKSR